MDFGSHLRAAREKRQLSLDAISARTKIPRQLCVDLEANDLSRWPKHQIYRHGFLRAYAAAVGLDAEGLITEFLHAFPDAPPVAPVEPPTVKPRRRSARWLTAAVAALGIGSSVLLVLVVDAPTPRDDRSAVQAVSPQGSRPAAGHIRLEPEARTATSGTVSIEVAPSTADIEGELLIESEPTDALVLVNGIGRGRTPARVQFLPLGSYTIRLVHAGYESLEQRITLTATRPVRTVKSVLQERVPVSSNSPDP